MDKPILCRLCAHNRLMPVVLGNRKEERWWCPCGVVNQQERTECFYFVREVGADDE